MANSSFTAAQYGQAARNLLPRGRAWPRDEGGEQAAFWDAIGEIYAQQDSDSVQMLADFFPATATQGLPEWNAALGIPDPCLGAPATQAINQQWIVVKLIASGGQSIAYFTQLAAAIGYQISITEFNATNQTTGEPAGFIVNPDDWAHTWRVNVLNAGSATSFPQLECIFNSIKPAHTQFWITVGTPPAVSDRLFNVTDNVAQALTIESR